VYPCVRSIALIYLGVCLHGCLYVYLSLSLAFSKYELVDFSFSFHRRSHFVYLRLFPLPIFVLLPLSLFELFVLYLSLFSLSLSTSILSQFIFFFLLVSFFYLSISSYLCQIFSFSLHVPTSVVPFAAIVPINAKTISMLSSFFCSNDFQSGSIH